uniref:Uncharacterized protein n=1 Tax=Anguilla anguilla TaxID=7936 RepID=A0A0E9VF38_ANGAN
MTVVCCVLLESVYHNPKAADCIELSLYSYFLHWPVLQPGRPTKHLTWGA